MAERCPSAGALERFALGAEDDGAVRAHVERCPSCAQRAETIRDNQRFLAHAAPVLARAICARCADGPAAPGGIPDSVPGYELHEEVARGGQGVVYRGVQSATRRRAAVKVLASGNFASARQRRRFEREVEIAASLRHPNLVTVFGSGQTDTGRPFVAMEFVDGVPIDEYALGRFGGVDESRGGAARERVRAVLRLMRSVAAGVAHAHGAGIIHRDLKPSNIIVEADGTARVLDFGLARGVDAPIDATVTQEFVGTPAYASPEQLEGGGARIGTSTDVYALGVVLYRLLTGRHPYPSSGSFLEVADHARRTDPPAPSRYAARIPGDVDAIVLTCLAKDPQRRYPNAGALTSDIDDWLEGRPISARRDSTAYVLRKLALRHRGATFAGALVVLTALGAAIGLGALARSLDLTRRDAEARLATSEIMRARLAADTGDFAQAEATLWRQAVLSGFRSDAAASAQEPRMTARVRWALVEIYSKSPAVLRARLREADRLVGFGSDGLWTIDAHGSRAEWSRDGRLVRQSDPPLEPGAQVVDVDPTGTFCVGGTAASFSLVDVRTGRTVAGPVPRVSSNSRFEFAQDADLLLEKSAHGAAPLGVFRASTLTPVLRIDAGVTGAQFMTGPGGETWVVVVMHEDPGFALVALAPPHWRPVRRVPLPGHWPADLSQVCHLVYCLPSSSKVVCAVKEHIGVADLDTERFTQVRDLSVWIRNIRFEPATGSMLCYLRNRVFALVSTETLGVERSFAAGGDVGHVALETQRRLIASVSREGDLCVHELDDRSWLERIDASEDTHAGAAVAPDGAIAWGDDAGMLCVRTGPGSPTACVPAHRGSIRSVDFTPDGAEIVTAGQDGSVRTWRRDGTPVRTIASGLPGVWCARVSPDGDVVAACTESGTAWIWGRDGTPVATLDVGGERLPKLAFSPDGAALVVQPVLGGAQVWDVRRGTRVRTLAGHAERITRAAAWSPDGRYIATGADDRTVRLWDAGSGALVATTPGLPWGPYDLAFHPSGHILFAAGAGGQLIVLDPVAGEQLAMLGVHARHTFSLSVARDGASVVSAGEDDWIGVTDFTRLARLIRGNEAYWRERLAKTTDAPR